MSQPERLGRYSILGLLGSGAMGDVYLAEDPQIERRLAIKTVRLGGSDEDVEERKQRLLREAKAAGKLIHPHVVTLFDYGEDQGVVYLAFEYVEGEDLRQRIDRQPPLTVREAVMLVRQTADALAIAHRHSIVHRDIKPANILLTASGAAKVTDFGIAKLRDQASNLTMSGSIIGTPHYMSPEQVKGEPLDGRSDLFSLGSVFFEILHGSRPFQADSVTTVVYLILHHDPFDEMRRDLPRPLAEVLARMLAKDPAQRYERCEEVVEAIDRVLTELSESQLAAPAIGPSPVDPMLGETTALPSDLPPVSARPPSGPPTSPPPAGPPPTGVPPTAAPPPTGVPATAAPAPPAGFVPPTGTAAPPQPAGEATTSQRAKRSPVWILAGCIGLPLLVGAGLLAIFAKPAIEWFQEQRSAAVSSESSDAIGEIADLGSETVPPVGAESAPDELGESGAETGPGGETGDGSVADASTAAGSEPQVSGSATPRGSSTTPPPASTPPASTPSGSSTPASPTSDRPVAGRRDPPPTRRETPATTPTAVEDDEPARPEPVESEPAAPPVQMDVAYDSRLATGLRLSLDVEPEEAYVLLRSESDTRFTSVGQAKDYDASKRRGEPFGIPSDGVHFLMLRAEGFADHVVRLDVDPAQSAVTTFSLRMGRPGSRTSAGGGGDATEVSVREGITFVDGPRRARVEVDGREVGQLRRYQDGNLLRLDPGRHRVAVTQGSIRFELVVTVEAGAQSGRRLVTLGVDD